MKKLLLNKFVVCIFLGLCLCIYLCPLSYSSQNVNQGCDLEQVIDKIKQREGNLETFIAKFVQTKKTILLKEPLRSEGFIYFDRTGKMLWKVTKPSPFSVLFTKDGLFLHYPDLSRTKKIPLANSDNILGKYFGVGESTEQLKKYYDIELAPENDITTCSLKLTPKMSPVAKHVRAIEVMVSKKTWLPEQLRLRETNGNFTSLRLYFRLVNGGLPDGIFSTSFF